MLLDRIFYMCAVNARSLEYYYINRGRIQMNFYYIRRRIMPLYRQCVYMPTNIIPQRVHSTIQRYYTDVYIACIIYPYTSSSYSCGVRCTLHTHSFCIKRAFTSNYSNELYAIVKELYKHVSRRDYVRCSTAALLSLLYLPIY